MQKKTVTLIPGDGIGSEICGAVQKIFIAASAPIEWDVQKAGLDVFEKTGELLPQNVIDSLEKHKVALKGPTTTPSGGGHRSINVTMRQFFKLYSNVRPVKTLPGIDCRYTNVDFIIVRENSEDLYKGIEYQVSEDMCHGVKLITRQASERIGRAACKLAVARGRKKVTVVHKANIMKLTDGLFLKSIQKLKSEFPALEIDDLLVDNTCLQLVKYPEQFDVIVTQNLYGDILSDLGSGLIGGLGVASGANIGDDKAIFEAVHGSAPDIAGQGLANPTALLMSAISMLEFLGFDGHGEKIRNALFSALESPETRTKDIGGTLGTEAFTEVIASKL
jgi:isocitrate dehydrogenase (NAD+)